MTAATPVNRADQRDIDERNRRFWDELCGTQLAKHLGVTDSSPQSLKRFDDWFLDFYSYLDRHLPFGSYAGKRVLEVGLGYGTVSQKLAEAGAIYSGLDIAEGPVAMVNHRLRQIGLPGEARQGSILDAPFPDESFDAVVAIGCYHHTGDVQRALDETWRLLVPGGTAMVMVYNAYSYRRWATAWGPTWRYWRWDKLGVGSPPEAADHEKKQYDANAQGEGAPSTSFTSIAHFRRMTRRFSDVRAFRENMWTEGLLKHLERKVAMRYLAPWIGLDLYVHLTK